MTQGKKKKPTPQRRAQKAVLPQDSRVQEERTFVVAGSGETEEAIVVRRIRTEEPDADGVFAVVAGRIRGEEIKGLKAMSQKVYVNSDKKHKKYSILKKVSRNWG